MICYIKEIEGLLSTLTKKVVFQGFQGLEKPVMNFKYFQALQGPVRTLYIKQEMLVIFCLLVIQSIFRIFLLFSDCHDIFSLSLAKFCHQGRLKDRK